MHFDNFDIEEVFNDYAKNMRDGGHLEKKATYVVPKSMLGDSNYTEIDVNEELRKIAADSGNSLYGLFTEDVMKGAHPEGSTKIVDAADGLGEVETLEATQAKMKDVAEKKVKLAKLVLAFASEIDAAGFHSLAQELDTKAAEFLGKGLKVKAALSPELQQTLADLSQSVGQALDQIQSAPLREQYKSSLGKHLADAANNEMAAKQLPKTFHQYLKHLASLPQEREAAMAMNQLAQSVYALPQAIDAAKAAPASPVEEVGVAKELTNEDKMKMVQQRLNQMFPDAGLAEDGNQGDRKTWTAVVNQLGLQPGKDFKNYDQLLAKLQ